MYLSGAFVSISAIVFFVAHAQLQLVLQQATNFNSTTFSLTQAQLTPSNISNNSVLATNLERIVNFDRSQLANGGSYNDEFYTLPPLATGNQSQPGDLLKIQTFTNLTSFSLPPGMALSRFLYATTNVNGTVIPASAFVLWPFAPRPSQFTCGSGSDTPAQTVVWAHGTSGWTPLKAPSTHRALWYGTSGPFLLAHAGYAVVAPDYAGLGVGRTWNDEQIPHQYLVSSAGALDSLYALRAARTAFPGKLSDEFVAVGHGQGGGVAWSIAELLASNDTQPDAGSTGTCLSTNTTASTLRARDNSGMIPAEGGEGEEQEVNDEFADLRAGFLGAVAGSPFTNLSGGIDPVFIPQVAVMLDSIFPDFSVYNWLTELGALRLALLARIEGGLSVASQLFSIASATNATGNATAGAQAQNPFLLEGFDQTWYFNAYVELAQAGGKQLGGPLLVIQGTEDPRVMFNITAASVEATCDAYSQNDVEFIVGDGLHHRGAFGATRHLWLKWVDDRFQGKPLEATGCTRTDITSFQPLEQYQTVANSFLQWAGTPAYSYEVPLGL